MPDENIWENWILILLLETLLLIIAACISGSKYEVDIYSIRLDFCKIIIAVQFIRGILIYIIFYKQAEVY